jgi:hypothetical protein
MATGAISGSAGGGGHNASRPSLLSAVPGTVPGTAGCRAVAVGCRYCCYYRYRMRSAAALLRCALCVSRKGPPMASVPCPASKPCARTLSWRPPHGPRKAQRRPAPLLRPKGAKERRLWLWHQRSGPLGSRLSAIHSRARGLRVGGGGCARSLYTRSLLLFARSGVRGDIRAPLFYRMHLLFYQSGAPLLPHPPVWRRLHLLVAGALRAPLPLSGPPPGKQNKNKQTLASRMHLLRGCTSNQKCF